MNIKITADSTCDLSDGLINENRVEIFPLYIVKGDETFKDKLEISTDDIFNYYTQTKKLCSTSAVSEYDYEQRFKALSKEYDAVIHIGMSSELSSSCQNAKIAAENFDNVYVADSQSLTTGYGFMVLKAAEMAALGKSVEEILNAVEEMKPKIEASFLIENLEFLVKGGRCSSVAALGANLLHLKPCIDVAEGRMKVSKKYKGCMEKCLHEYVTDRLISCDDLDTERIFITYPDYRKESVDTVIEAIKECSDFKNITQTVAGGTVASHCGPGTLGIIFMHK